MSREDLCKNCHHTFGSHTNYFAGNDYSCFWPKCPCKQFEE